MFVCLTCAIPEGYQGGYISHACGPVDAPKLRKKPTGGRPEECRIYDESGHETEYRWGIFELHGNRPSLAFGPFCST